MIIGNAARLAAAQQALLRFIQVGRVTDAKAALALQHSPAGWPVTRDAYARQIKQRLDGSLPNQVETDYCGPAAFLDCLIHDRPDIYVGYAVSLWEHGHFTFGTPTATVKTDSGHGEVPAATQLVKTRVTDRAHGHINDVDWMTMSCLSASTRPVGLWAVTPSDEGGSITYPWVMKRWFLAAGATLRESTMGIGAFQSSLLDTLGLFRYWPSCWIVLQIDVSLLKNADTDFFGGRHWVVVDPHHQPLAYKQPGNTPVPFSAAIEAIWAATGQHANGQIKAAGGLANMDDAAAAKLEQQAASDLEGTPVANWTTNLRVSTWAEEGHGIYSGRLGRLIGRIYGGFAFSRFS